MMDCTEQRATRKRRRQAQEQARGEREAERLRSLTQEQAMELVSQRMAGALSVIDDLHAAGCLSDRMEEEQRFIASLVAKLAGLLWVPLAERDAGEDKDTSNEKQSR